MDKKTRSDISIDDEVNKLFKKGKVTTTDFLKLKQRFDDVELADQIQRAFVERHSALSRRAKKFAQLIREKYSNQQYPFHVLLSKARLFKTKHNLTEEEFAEFYRIFEKELVGLRSTEVISPVTNLMKVLGSINVDMYGFPSKLDDHEYKILQEIIKLHASSRPLHSQVILQSVQYRDCDFEALSGEYKRELGNRPGDSVHPVIAAMFLPKIEILENTFLYSNIGNIIKSRYNNEHLTNKPDYELFYNLVNDPNDIVCDNRSPIADLHNRALLQTQLWNSVLHLRNGQYYNSQFRDFVSSVDVCRLNKHDNPDLVYGRYDGTVIKRLLSAFSFRPTVVATTPAVQLVNLNPYQQHVRPIVTQVPMINLRMPISMNDQSSISLNDALEQNQFFLEGGIMVPRQTSIIYSRGVLFFYVDRRANVIRFNDIQPFNVSRLPVSISGFERLNPRPVTFEPTISVRGDTYKLRSVVLAEVNRNMVEKNIVVGSSALILTHPNHEQGVFQHECFYYDPLGVTDAYLTEDGKFANRPPVTQIQYHPGIEGNVSFIEMAQSRGIIFMYESSSDQPSFEVTY
jgi:hypothetical protein